VRTSTRSCARSKLIPNTPVVVTVWIFPDANHEDGERFQINILSNGKFVLSGFEAICYSMYNHLPALLVDRVAIDYPLTIEIHTQACVYILYPFLAEILTQKKEEDLV